MIQVLEHYKKKKKVHGDRMVATHVWENNELLNKIFWDDLGIIDQGQS